MVRCSFSVVHATDDFSNLVIRDLDQSVSVTNDVENLVAHLFSKGMIQNRTSLLYYDTEGSLDRILHQNGKFVGFAPGPRNREARGL